MITVSEKLTLWFGYLSALLMVMLVVLVSHNVVLRYFFNDVNIGLQELEWHLFSVIFLIGMSYSFQVDAHVRVDIFYEKMSKKSAWVDAIGIMFFLWPFSFLIIYYSIEFSYSAYQISEISGDPGGLTDRWIVKGMVAVSFFLLFVSSLGRLLRLINFLRGV